VTDAPAGRSVLGNDTDGSTAPGEPVGNRRAWMRWLRRAFAAAVVVALAVLIWQQRVDVSRALHSMSPWLVFLSLLLGIVGAWLPGVVWRDVLASQGYPTPFLAGQRAFFVAQLGKYLPGGIWALVAQVALARDMRIPGRQAATATFLTIVVSLISALLVAVVALPLTVPGLVSAYWWIFVAVPPLLALLHPRSVAWWSSTAFRVLRRPGAPVRLSWAVLLRAFLLTLISWLALGSHLALLVAGMGDAGWSLWVRSIGVFALGWVAGFLVIVAPAGAGVREGALVLGLGALLPAGAVLAAALVSRLLLTMADVVLAVTMAVTARVFRSRRASVEAPAAG
jgi:uncharacterized membrane protein YbhN (UPF0104 family)